MKNDMGVLLLWLGRKLARNHEALITKMDAIQNLFETSAEATASPSDIMEGKTAYNGTVLMTGAMENQGAKEATLLAGGTYNIPRGYHDGGGRVTATDLASQTPGTAEAGGILSGLKAWVAGKLIDGAMKDRRGTTVTTGAVTQDGEYTYLTVPEEACYSTNSKVRTQNSNLNNAIYNAIVAQGVTPASKNYADLATAIAAVKANNYNSGVTNGINSMAIHAVGGANTGTFTITNYAYCTKAYLVVEVVDDDRRSYASVIVPGGGCTEIHNLEYGQHDCYTNMQVFELTGLPAGTITINCALGYGRCAVLIGA